MTTYNVASLTHLIVSRSTFTYTQRYILYIHIKHGKYDGDGRAMPKKYS
jgi:hypothetical protein